MGIIMKDEKGFTLAEILVSAAVGMTLLGAIYLGINSVQRSSAGLEKKVVAQQDVRPVLELMATEIQMASYNPLSASGMWLDPANCFSASANQAYRGIQEATANAITIEMDITDTACTGGNGDGAIGDCNEIIRYNYDTVDQYITRQTRRSPPGSCSSAANQPFLGDTAANPRSVRVINNTLNISLFRYYDQTGAEILPAALPAGIPNIRRIDITIAVQTEDIDASTGQRRTMVYSTSVIPRNHAL
jgi:hypothetical protein